jgi:asparaginyl-tRNA synthetase
MELIRLWSAMFRGARNEVETRGFVGVHNMPEIVGVTGACENVDTLFKVDYFGKQAYLAQSDQLYLELITPHLEKVYAEIQSFRMEPEADNRHLTQFSLFEIEHQGNLDELMDNIEGILFNIIGTVLEADLDIIDSPMRYAHKRLLKQGCLPRVTYTEAVGHLQEELYPDLEWGADLKAHHERAIVDEFGACFVTHYPMPIKFFNMKQNDDDAAVVNSCDLLLPYAGESAGAAEREHEYTKIVNRLKASDMYKRLIELGGRDEDFEWYLEAHRGRDIPLHSGAGIGMARVAQFILGVDDIRDAVPFVINSENLL